ncbi:hypothetical protein H8959_009774 [Pygathrix nigripes]
MARVGPGRAGVSRQGQGQGRGRGRGGSGQRRPPTWEISDSDAEGPAGSEAAARARDPAAERRAAAQALRLLRPEQVLKRLAVCVDPGAAEGTGDARGRKGLSPPGGALRPTGRGALSERPGAGRASQSGVCAECRLPDPRLRPGWALARVEGSSDRAPLPRSQAILEDAGADVLMEALEALGCECRIEPQRPARSLRWTRARPDPCPCSLPPEVWAADEQEFLLLLEPEEFLQGVATLTQISGPTRWVPWISPETTTRSHLAVIGLDAYLWSRQHVARGTQQPESPKVAGAEVAIGWPQVEEALVLLQLWVNLDVLLVASWQELSQHVCAITKALAQCPLKCVTPGLKGRGQDHLKVVAVPLRPLGSCSGELLKGVSLSFPLPRQYRESQAFSFCTAGRWAAGEPVARDGTGLRGAWRRQIRQFSRVSPAVADAVVTAFPSPRLLQQALEACSTEQERTGLLADLPVLPSEGGRPRRVGPDLSRRICLFLTTANPDLLLDLGS